MDIEEKKEKIEFLQAYFVKSFWLSFVLLLFACFMCILMHNMQLEFVQKMFNMDEKTLNWIIVLTLGIWKVLIIQFTLIPALVIWCMRKCCKCKCSEQK